MLYSDQLMYRLASTSSPYDGVIVDHAALLYCMTSVLPGVHAWSQLVEGFVQSSMNLGMIEASHDQLRITYLPRSSDNHALETLFDHIRQAYDGIDATMTVRAQYPGREQDPSAPIVTTLRDIMTDVLGTVPHVQPIHA